MSRVWLVFTYAQAAPFSLRLSVATTTAAVTSLVPTPASFKLALVDVAFRVHGDARRVFDLVKAREVRVGLPDAIVVQKTFGRVLVPWESKVKASERDAEMADAKSQHAYPFKRTIAFTEIAFWSGSVRIAMDVASLSLPDRNTLSHLASHLSYLGKRGSFVQLVDVAEAEHTGVRPRDGYAVRTDQLKRTEWPSVFMSRPTDDLTPESEFDRISIATAERTRVGLSSVEKLDRLAGIPWLLPLRLVRTGKTFAFYKRSAPSREIE